MLFLVLATIVPALAQLAAWSPAGLSGYGPSPWAATTVAPNITVGGLTRGPGVGTGGTAAGNAWGGTNWAGYYASFTIQANAGYQVSLSSLSLFYRRSGTGPGTGQLQYSTDGSTFTNVPGGAFTYSSTSSSGASLPAVTLSTITDLQNVPCNTTITFRIVNYGGGSAGTWYVFGSGLSVTGTVATFPAPAITSSPVAATIPAGGSTSFTVSGVAAATSFQWQRNTSGLSGGTWVNISSATLDPTGTYSGFSLVGSATSSTLSLSGVPASWDGYAYRCIVTNCSGSSTSGAALLNVAAASCSGMPASGTAIPATGTFCGSGSTTLSLSGGTSATDITYQWSSSTTPVAPGTAITGATNNTFTTPVHSATTYYWCTSTCPTSGMSATSAMGTVSINPIPAVAATGGSFCTGSSGLTITATGADNYIWLPATGLSATTGSSVTATPTTNTTYTVTGTTLAGCSNTAAAIVSYVTTPSSLSVTPASATACAGDAAFVLRANGGTVGPTTVNSGVVTIPGTIAAFGTIAHGVMMAGIPAGAVITDASVNVINFGAAWQDDYVINVKAPNGNVLNLINQRGSHTSTVTTLFDNTNISSLGSASLGTGSGTFTGTWAADAAAGVGASPNIANVTTWSSLYSIPNGTWTLSIYNNTGFSNTVIPNMQWSITLHYTWQAPVTFAPLTDLYTDAAATAAYTGAATDSVFFLPTTAGTTTVTATANNTGCTSTATTALTVNPTPSAITGASAVCVGQTITVSATPAAGTWSVSNANANIDAVSGIITGVTNGTSVVTYTLAGGCNTTYTITINALPAAITGATSVCEGATTTLANTSTGGTWTASNSNANIDASTGDVTGVTAGTVTITYTLPTGCYTTYSLTVLQAPATIGGPSSVCEGSSIALTNTVGAGTWTSGSTHVAIDGTTGVANGITAGTSVITYTLPSGCAVQAVVTVHALPPAITGPGTVCANSANITLANAMAGGTWAASNTNLFISATGIVTGAGTGTTIVTYTSAEGCNTTTIVTVLAAPATITGTMTVCRTATTILANATVGGTWAATTGAPVTVGASSGFVTGTAAGTALISYTLGNGCYELAVVTVNETPTVITGLSTVCVNATVPLASTPTGGTWSSSSANAWVNATTGVVTGVTAGTTTLTYDIGTGCIATRIQTINPLPVAITGPSTVCTGASVTLTNSTGSGSWATSNASVATIDNTTGLLAGIATGTATIYYTLSGTGCAIGTTVTVHPTPSAIVGQLTICNGATVSYTNTTTGGVWSSSNSTIAATDATGNITGNTPGTATISYTIPATGCYRAVNATVTATPPGIAGSMQMCPGHTTAFSNPVPGGTWSSANTAVGTINSTTGVFTSLSVGTSTITYSLLSGCTISRVVTVTPLPPAITGTTTFCRGNSVMLLNSVTGGTWTGSDASVISVDAGTGVVTGIVAGTALVSYTTGAGCTVTTMVSVHPLPATITGTFSVCEGATTTLANTSTGGAWISGNTTVATINSSTGVATGVSAGIAYITYTLPGGCASYATLTVNALPGAIGTVSVCQGSTTTLSPGSVSGTWSSGTPAVATVSAAGVVFGAAAGTAIVTFTGINGCATNGAITVNALPAVYSVTGGGNYCAGGTGVSIGLSGSQLGVTYQLYSVAGLAATTIGTGTATSFGLLTPAGVYTATAVNTATGCSRSMSGSTFVIIQPLAIPSVSMNFSSVGDTSCAGAPLTATAFPTNGGTLPVYNWYVNGTWFAAGVTCTVTPINGDVVSVKMASNLACRSADTVTVLATRYTIPSLAPSATLGLTPNDTVCSLVPVTFTTTAINAGTTPYYQWYRNASPIMGATNSTYTTVPAHANAYRCLVGSTYRCRLADTVSTIGVPMTVQLPVIPTVTINVSPSLTIATGQLCTFTAATTNAGPAPTFQWYINGTEVPGATNAFYSTTTLTNGNVITCKVYSSGICSGVENYDAVVMTVLTPSGINQQAIPTITVQPNPSAGSFIVTTPADWSHNSTEITLTNMIGQRVHTSSYAAGEAIDVMASLPAGNYLLTLTNGTQRINTTITIH